MTDITLSHVPFIPKGGWRSSATFDTSADTSERTSLDSSSSSSYADADDLHIPNPFLNYFNTTASITEAYLCHISRRYNVIHYHRSCIVLGLHDELRSKVMVASSASNLTA